jgi:predicted nucleic acid-binding Zn ribbon protein
MKRRSNEQSLGEAIARLVDSTGMRGKLDELDVLTAWDHVAGPMVARHTISVRLRGDRLHLRFDSAPLRQEISYMKEGLVKLLNTRLGREVVREVVVE